MHCVECGTVIPAEAETEDLGEADVPAVVVFCESCTAGEFGDGPDW